MYQNIFYHKEKEQIRNLIIYIINDIKFKQLKINNS